MKKELIREELQSCPICGKEHVLPVYRKTDRLFQSYEKQGKANFSYEYDCFYCENGKQEFMNGGMVNEMMQNMKVAYKKALQKSLKEDDGNVDSKTE